MATSPASPRPRRRPVLRALLALVALGSLGLALLVVAGFGGRLHPALDSVGHFRAQLSGLAVLAGLLALGLGPGRLARGAGALALAVGLAGGATALPYMLPSREAVSEASGAPAYTLMHMNLRFDAPVEPAIALLAERRPDVVTLAEVTPRWRERLDALEALYPHRFYCDRPNAIGDIAILSRRAFTDEGLCRPLDSFVARGIDFNGRSVTVVAQHLQWPWPERQWRQIRRLAEVLPNLSRPLVVGGDFNAAAWSAAVGGYAENASARVVTGLGATYLDRRLPRALLPILGLPIDSLLVSDGIEVVSAASLPATASDHLPSLLVFRLAEAPGPATAARYRGSKASRRPSSSAVRAAISSARQAG